MCSMGLLWRMSINWKDMNEVIRYGTAVILSLIIVALLCGGWGYGVYWIMGYSEGHALPVIIVGSFVLLTALMVVVVRAVVNRLIGK